MSSNNLNSLGVKTTGNKKSAKLDIPFYEPASPLPTSSQIIKEAREKLHETKHAKKAGYLPHETSGLIRTLNSTRPFTPREEKRTLFGPKSTRPIHERPPSSFLIGSKSFDTDPSTSRPISATRLSPIEVRERPNSSKLSSQTSIDCSDLISNSRSCIEEERILPIASQSKVSLNSRLAPLEVTNEKEKIKSSIKVREYEFTDPAGKSRDAPGSATSTNSMSATASDSQTETKWKSQIEPLLNAINTCYKDNLVDQFCEACDKLNKALEINGMFSKSCAKRSTILKLIFKYLDSENDRMKLKVAKIILNMKVNSNNLTNICRLVFSISRNTDNDIIFMQHDLLDPFLSSSKRLDFKANPDSITYFCGTVKNLSENQKLLKQLSQKNLEDILSKIIKDISKYYSNKESFKSEAGHALVQLTATLRNLADLSSTRHKFLSLNLIEELVSILKYFSSDSELMLNVSRILSKLTLHADCCQKIIANTNSSIYKSFIKIMLKHDLKQDLIVRIGFVLGNITSRHDEARIEYMSEKYSLDTLIKILRLYLDLDEKSLSGRAKGVEENEPNTYEDVLIKFMRVIANVAINENAGATIANRPDLLEILLKILDTKDLSCEELIIDTIVTINNISFYDSEIIVNNSQYLIDSLMKYLLSENFDAILEVFRVFANLSRHHGIRSYLISKKVNLLAISYLNSNNREMVYIVIGVLINIMSDPENRYVLKQEKGVKKLIEILIEVGPTDWQISSIVCQLLMNYSEKFENSTYRNFEHNELILLNTVLTELLDEKFALSDHPCSSGDNENIDEYMRYLWSQDFSPVASLLLERINNES